MTHFGRNSLRWRALYAIATLVGTACGGRVSYGDNPNTAGESGISAGGRLGSGNAGSASLGSAGSGNGGTSSGSAGSASLGGSSQGGAPASGGNGSAGTAGSCRPGDPSCGTWRTCELEPSTFDAAAMMPKTVCDNNQRVTAVALPSERLDGLNARFALVASPTPNIVIAGPSQSTPTAALFGLTPDLRLVGGWNFESANATSVDTVFLRRGSGGRTFLVGTTDGHLFPSGKNGQDVFVLSTNAARLEPEWSAQIGSDKPAWVYGAAATLEGGLAAVGTLGSPGSRGSKRMLWVWDKTGTFTARELKFDDARAVPAGFDTDAQGNFYLITTPHSGLRKLSSTGDVLSTTATNADLDCTYCQALVATQAGASYLLGTREIADGRIERRLSRHDVDGRLTWSVVLSDQLIIQSLFASGDHVIGVGTSIKSRSNPTGVLVELDQAGSPVRQLRFGSNVDVLSASRADSGRVDVLVHAPDSTESRLVQLAP